MIAFEVFRSLGVEVLVRPVLEHISNIDYGNPLDETLRTHHHVGKELGKPLKTEAVWGYGDNLLRQVYAEYPNTLIKVKWVNEPMDATKSVQFGFALVCVALMPMNTGAQLRYSSMETNPRLSLCTASVRCSSKLCLTLSGPK